METSDPLSRPTGNAPVLAAAVGNDPLATRRMTLEETAAAPIAGRMTLQELPEDGGMGSLRNHVDELIARAETEAREVAYEAVFNDNQASKEACRKLKARLVLLREIRAKLAPAPATEVLKAA